MDAQQIIDLLNQLASKLSGPAQQVFDAAVRQTVLDGVGQAIWAFVLILLFPFLVLRSARKFNLYMEKDRNLSTTRWLSKDADYELYEALASLVSRIIATISFFIGLACVQAAISYILNPQWQVILKLAGLVTGTPTK